MYGKLKFILPHCASKHSERARLRSTIPKDWAQHFEVEISKEKVGSDMKGSVCSCSHCKHNPRIKDNAAFRSVRAFRFTSVHFCLCTCVFILLRASCTWPIFPHCAASTPLGRKTREINYVSCWWGFDVKSWGKRCSVTFSLHLLCVIQRVQPPPKSPSPSCCSPPAFRDISHVIKADRKFDFHSVKSCFPVVSEDPYSNTGAACTHARARRCSSIRSCDAAPYGPQCNLTNKSSGVLAATAVLERPAD